MIAAKGDSVGSALRTNNRASSSDGSSLLPSFIDPSGPALRVRDVPAMNKPEDHAAPAYFPMSGKSIQGPGIITVKNAS